MPPEGFQLPPAVQEGIDMAAMKRAGGLSFALQLAAANGEAGFGTTAQQLVENATTIVAFLESDTK